LKLFFYSKKRYHPFRVDIRFTKKIFVEKFVELSLNKINKNKIFIFFRIIKLSIFRKKRSEKISKK